MSSTYDATRSEMLPFVPSSCRRVLDVGCDTGRFGAALADERSIEVSGVDVATMLSESNRPHYRAFWEGSFPGVVPEPERFDCVVFNDVLEHMVDPWAALEATHALLDGGRYVVGSMPNLRHYPVILDLALRGRFDYCDDGVLDRTHLRFFTRATIVDLLRDTGFEIETIVPIRILRSTRRQRLLALFGSRIASGLLARQFAFVARSVR